MRQARVFYKNDFAGIISEHEHDEGYSFQYDATYLTNPHSKPVSLTLPDSMLYFQPGSPG